MKKILVLISLVLTLYADNNSSTKITKEQNIWNNLMAIEAKFFTYSASTKAILDNTLTQDDVNTHLLKSMDEKSKAFNLLIRKIKVGSLSMDDNVFFDSSKFSQNIYTLKTRIKTNLKYKRDLAVRRDNIKIKTYELKQKIFLFFTSTSRTWIYDTKGEFQTLIEDELRSIKSEYLNDFEKRYLALNKKNSDVAQELKVNLADLYTQYVFYSEFLNYVNVNSKMFQYKSFIDVLNLKNIINTLNDTTLAKETNKKLRYIHTDLGRLSLSIFVMLLTFLVGTLIYRGIYNYLKNKNDKTSKLLLKNFEHLRKPFFIIIFFLGMEIALEILFYTTDLDLDSTFFIFMYIGISSYILVVLSDNVFYYLILNNTAIKNIKMRSELINLSHLFIKIAIYTGALIVFFIQIEVNIATILAPLGIGALAISLAAKDTLSNVFGLLKIISDKSFSQGDYIQIPQASGTVVEIKLVSTTLRTDDNALVTIPNTTLANASLINWSRRNIGRRIMMNIGLTYNASRESVILVVQQIKMMLQAHKEISSDENLDKEILTAHQSEQTKLLSTTDRVGIMTAQFVCLNEFGDSSINILVDVYTKTVSKQAWLGVKQDVMLKIWEIVDANNLEFAFPSQTIYFDNDSLEDIPFKS